MMSGRKLDMVCSTQPYGKEVRYSRAPNNEPAIDGEIRSDNRREPGSTCAGKARVNVADPVSVREPPLDSASLTPGGFTGSSSSSASDSSSVSASPCTVALLP